MFSTSESSSSLCRLPAPKTLACLDQVLSFLPRQRRPTGLGQSGLVLGNDLLDQRPGVLAVIGRIKDDQSATLTVFKSTLPQHTHPALQQAGERGVDERRTSGAHEAPRTSTRDPAVLASAGSPHNDSTVAATDRADRPKPPRRGREPSQSAATAAESSASHSIPTTAGAIGLVLKS